MDAGAMDVVTGAFGYTGKYITRRLLSQGRRVRTLTGHPERPNPFGAQVDAAPFQFDRPDALAESLRGAATLYNTYWVGFAQGGTTFEVAIRKSVTLLGGAGAGGVRRVVHVSISNPSEDSPLPYFRGKAILERALAQSGLSQAIIRPTVIFGPEDILINNIAWILRRFPVFAVPGAGQYRMQPVFVEDMAEICVDAGRRDDDLVMDAVGPEVFSFEELVRLIARTIGSRAWIGHAPAGMALLLSRLVGAAVGDVVLTADEVKGLMANLLVSAGPPTGRTRLSDWLAENAGTVGAHYASEVRRHFRG